MGCSKSSSKKKVLINAYLKKKVKSQIHKPTLHLKEPVKEEHKMPTVRRKEIKIIAKINETETKKN